MPLTGTLAFNMTSFKKIVNVAAFAGILAGLLLTLIQQVQIAPLILEAEQYEQASDAVSHNDQAPTIGAHEHEHDAWQPDNGLERILFTTAANIVVAFGFALLLGAAIALRRSKPGWRYGLLWGMAGYAVFFVAPSLGLPPEIPGTQSAALVDRQMWWIFTVVFTVIGLWFIVFSGKRIAKIIGVASLIVPHLIGAPQPSVHGGVAPAALEHAFVLATIVANMVFWLALGALFGFFHQRMAVEHE
ncbi:putative cobalt transporter subunit (CbtA) [mine drainage metagenome]|uniref:Putative cobalt transporter subunit (CbtA) n=1 Tax=mine drainage metagenome TaxID=410659 RepID=A0A1J5QD57_9ZZZZ